MIASRPSRALLLAAAAGASFLACGSEEERPHRPSTNGGSAGTAGSPRGGAAGKSGAGGASAGRGNIETGGRSSAEAGSGGGDAGQGGEADDPAEMPPPAALCVPGASFGSPVRLALSTSNDDELGSITPDELTLAWTSGGTAFVADRAAKDAAFSPALEVRGAGYFARAITSADGLWLIGARIDGRGFGLMVRAARGDAFSGTPDESAFEVLYSAPAMRYAEGPFADPVFDAGRRLLLYSALDAASDGVPSVYESNFASGILPWGNAVQGTLLFAVEGEFRRPSAISTDGRTLFYWDEVSGEMRAAWRPSRKQAFDSFEALGARRNVAPNAACDRIYFTAEENGAKDLFFADRE